MYYISVLLTSIYKKEEKLYVPIIAAYVYFSFFGLFTFITSLFPSGGISLSRSEDVEQAVQIARAGGMLDSNTHALYSSTLLLLTMPFILRSKNETIKRVYILIGIANIIFSQSRSIWGSLLLVGIITYIFKRDYVKKLIGLFRLSKYYIVVIIFLVFSLLLIIVPRVLVSQSFFSDEGGGSLRYVMIQQGMQLLMQHPIAGFGQGMGIKIFFDYFPKGYIFTFPHPVHNIFLQIALESGVLGMIVLFIPLISSIKSIGMHSIYKKTMSAGRYAAGMAAIVLLLYGCTQPIILRHDGILFGIITGIIYAKTAQFYKSM